jgi:hypothetical protein
MPTQTSTQMQKVELVKVIYCNNVAAVTDMWIQLCNADSQPTTAAAPHGVCSRHRPVYRTTPPHTNPRTPQAIAMLARAQYNGQLSPLTDQFSCLWVS